MRDITVILPLVDIKEDEKSYLKGAIDSVYDNCKSYKKNGKVKLLVVGPESVEETAKEAFSGWNKFLKEDYTEKDFQFIKNDGKTDFCSQIDFAVSHVATKWFSILEFDDEYASNWFNMVHEYHYGNEDVSVFLPINQVFDVTTNGWQFGNEPVWASSFSSELGFFDEECLQNNMDYYLSGGVFNKEDFEKIGGIKTSIGPAFSFEFLLRAVHDKLKVYVVPKEGYKHLIGREGSVSKDWYDNIPDEDVEKYFDLAKREYTFKEDRGNGIINLEKEELK